MLRTFWYCQIETTVQLNDIPTLRKNSSSINVNNSSSTIIASIIIQEVELYESNVGNSMACSCSSPPSSS